MNQITHQQYTTLRAFRQDISSAIRKRHDAAFNALDALLERPKPRSIAELSLSPCCPRQWSSLYDMVEEAVFDKSQLEALYRQTSLQDWRKHGKEQAALYGFSEPCLVALSDASMIRRSSCRVVDGLRYCHTQSHEVGGRRMRHDRDLWYAPPPVAVKGRGAPRTYGEVFDTKDATTWTMPDSD